MKLASLLLAFSLSLNVLFNPFRALFHPKDYVAAHTIQSIVKITGIREDGEPEVCTGFVVGPKLILTANHCAADKMEQDGIPVKVVKVSEWDDLMLLSTEFLGKKPLKIRGRPVEKYEELTGIGYAWGWERPLVLAELAVWPALSPSVDKPVGVIVQGGYVPGMSGGPLVDKDGKVVGVMQMSDRSIGYGVGSDRIEAFLAGLVP